MVQVINSHGLSCLARVNGGNHFVIFIHGFPDTKEVWMPVIRALPQDIQFIAPDLPSFGESEIVSDSDMRLDSIVDRICKVLDTMGCASYTLVAHDWGSIIAWQLYSRFARRVDAMIHANGPHPYVYHNLLNTSPAQREIGKYASFFCSDLAVGRLSMDGLKALKRFHPFSDSDGPGSEEFFQSKWSDPHRLGACLGIYRSNFNDLIEGHVTGVTSAAPVRILWGVNDHSLVREQAHDVREFCAAGCEILYVEGGHWSFLEHTEKFKNLILGI